MRYQFRPWLLIAAVAVASVGTVGAIYWFRSRAVTPASLMERLPHRDALVAYVDFQALRRGGMLKLLDGSKSGEDPDYRSFVEKTHFDYTRDLDAAMLAFAPNGKFILAKGRFDWKSLQAYVRSQGGDCRDSFCRMVGSAPDRRISFFPAQSGLMALAVSQDDSAALRMSAPAPAPKPDLPDAPVWLSVPASVLKSGAALPAETREFARALGQADSLMLAFSPEGEHIAATLEISCVKPGDAVEIAAQLTRATAVLRDMMTQENRKPDPADLSGILSAGVFRAEGARVLGRWPIQKAFLDGALAQ